MTAERRIVRVTVPFSRFPFVLRPMSVVCIHPPVRRHHPVRQAYFDGDKPLHPKCKLQRAARRYFRVCKGSGSDERNLRMTAKPFHFPDLVGPHPSNPHPCGQFPATDQHTDHGVPHRLLDGEPIDTAAFTVAMTQWIKTHHLSPEAAQRDRKRREALARQGLVDPTKRFPSNPSTQKGNWVEILLAEYLSASCAATLPIYRLRYNPNVDQSMKGDDVLAFDLDADPVRLLVGEAKFRSTPSKAVVEELAIALLRSHAGNVPASLQFVADRLYESGNHGLGDKVASCNDLFASGRLRLDYVGLLVSTPDAHHHVKRNAQSTFRRLVVISMGLLEPERLVDACFATVGAEL